MNTIYCTDLEGEWKSNLEGVKVVIFLGNHRMSKIEFKSTKKMGIKLFFLVI